MSLSPAARLIPLLYLQLQAVQYVAMGAFHTVAVTDVGAAAFGANDFGQLGTGNAADRQQPAAVAGLDGRAVISVACGAAHTLFLCRCAAWITSAPPA